MGQHSSRPSHIDGSTQVNLWSGRRDDTCMELPDWTKLVVGLENWAEAMFISQEYSAS